MKKIITLMLSLALLLNLFGCAPKEDIAPKDDGKVPVTDPVKQPEPTPEPTTLSIFAVGDNLLHNTVTADCKTADGYDFTKLYTNIESYISNADLSFINQEVPLAGLELGNGKFPNLNAPKEVARDIKSVGFNVVNMGTNHTFDVGKKGADITYSTLKEAGFENVLGYTPEGTEKGFDIFEKNDIKVGLLSYTYGSNSYSKIENIPSTLSVIEKEKMTSDITALKLLCDTIVVSMHWGQEYTTTPSDVQKETAQLLADLGVGVILGHHPHVIQPVEIITGKNGNEMVCFYSLGNYVSHQQRADTMLGGGASVTIEKSADGDISFKNVGVYPLATYFNTKAVDFAVLKLRDYTQELAESSAVIKKDSKLSKSFLDNLAADVFGDFLLEVE